MTPEKFFHLVYQHTPQPKKQLIAWGSVDNPTYFTIDELISSGVLDDIPQDQDVYFTPLVLTEPRRKKENVAGGSVVWVDVDAHRGEHVPLLPPSIVIKSGQGKHLYWLLDNFYNAVDIERANKNLFACLGQEGGNEWNRSRVLRVPGSINWKCNNPKYKNIYTVPVPCVILEWHPENVYSLSDLSKLAPVEIDYLSTPTYKNGELDQSRRDWKLVKQLFAWGINEYAVRMALLYHSAKAQDRPEDYVNLTINKVKEALGDELTTGGTSGTGPQEQFANATIEPLAFLVTPEGDETGLAVKISWPGRYIIAPATAKDFINARAVTDWFAKHGAANRIWTASDGKAKHYYNYLVARCPNITHLQVGHAGRYDLGDKRAFVYDIDKALVFPKDANLEVFWKPEIKIDNRLTFADKEISREEGEYLLGLVQKVQPAEVVQPALGWLLMSPFKTLLWEGAAVMPILLLFGFAGSGKSSFIGRVLMPLIGKFDRQGRFPKAVASDSGTFSILGQTTQTQSWPVWFGEYRPTNLKGEEFERILREVYDESFENRGRPDLSIKQFNLVSPVIVDGEGPFTQTANAERTLALQLTKEAVAPGTLHYEVFQALQAMPPLLFRKFALTYVKWSLTKSAEDISEYLIEGFKVFQSYSSAARIANNLRVAWAGLSILRQFCIEKGWNVEVDQELSPFLSAMNTTHVKGLGVRSDADVLCEQITHFWDKPDMGTDYDSSEDILWFNLTKSRHTLKFSSDINMLNIQLSQRKTTYLRGPMRRTGEAEYWGIHIATAQALGLDVARPYDHNVGPIVINPNGQGVYT